MAGNQKQISFVGPDGAIHKKTVAKKQDKKNDLNKQMTYLSLGYYILTPIILGVFGGWWLDNTFGSKPVFVLTGIITGTLAAYYHLYKIIKDG